MTEEQKMLFSVVYDFIHSAQREAANSKACCRALTYLSRNLTDDEFQSLKDSFNSDEFYDPPPRDEKEEERLMRKWVDEDYPKATDEQKANLLKLFKEV